MEVELLNQRRGEKNNIQLFQKKLNAKKPRFPSSGGAGGAVWGGEAEAWNKEGGEGLRRTAWQQVITCQ